MVGITDLFFHHSGLYEEFGRWRNHGSFFHHSGLDVGPRGGATVGATDGASGWVKYASKQGSDILVHIEDLDRRIMSRYRAPLSNLYY